MEQMRAVKLYGKLGTKFGRVHNLHVSSAAEAVRALCSILPGFERELMTSKDRGVAYSVFNGTRNLDKDELNNLTGAREIRIAPVILGSKKAGVMQVILGVVLIAASVFFPPLAGSAYAASATMLGASMALGGVVQMLTPQQKGLSSRDSPDNGASYNFNGPVNTTAQGNPVPLLYGEMHVGSAVISAGVYAEDQI